MTGFLDIKYYHFALFEVYFLISGLFIFIKDNIAIKILLCVVNSFQWRIFVCNIVFYSPLHNLWDMGKNFQPFLKLILPKVGTKNIQLKNHLSREKRIKQCWNKCCGSHASYWKYITIIIITFITSSLSLLSQLFLHQKKRKDKKKCSPV